MSEPAFHERFDALAARAPAAPAVESAAERLTYGELASRSNRLARLLMEEGVRPETPVAVDLEPSADWVIALLAIWKAGGVYLPLDPGLPNQRRALLVEEARPALTVTRRWLAGAARRLTELPSSAPERRSAPGELAYLLYTSGSTGRPKGVAIEHRGLANLAPAHAAVLGLGAGDRVLQFAPLGFDSSIAELVMALGTGATLCFAPRAVGPALTDLLARLRISCVTLPPSLLAVLPDAPLAELRTLLAAGEACPREVVERWAPGRRFFNLYGPTEATIWSTAATCEPGRRPTIGRAIPGVELHVLDERGAPAPIGVPGELYIGGAGVARGYWNAPALTAEKFVANPFGAGRLFRSGDRVRRGDGGELEFLGRVDDQVKIRGCRVEPGEVEAALGALPEVRAAAVVAREHAPGDVRLRACVVASGAVGAAQLRARLAARLPDYLVPAQILLFDALPTTANGKIDRAALAALTPREGAEPAPPRDDGERWLAEAAAALLGLARVDLDADFFAQGGDSLLAARLATRAREERGLALGWRELFESPLRALAHATDAAPHPHAIATLESGAEPVASSGQERLWLAEQLQPGQPGYHAALLIRLRGPLAAQPDAIRRSLDEIVRRHEPLRTTFAAGDGPLRLVVQPAAPLDVALEDLRALPEPDREPELARRAAELSRPTFDLQTGPLLRALLVRLRDDETALALTLHHVAADAWSTGALIEELAALVPAFAEGRASPLPDVALTHSDLAAHERALDQAAAPALLAYWTRQLAGAPPLPLATDRPLPLHRARVGGRVPLAIDPPLARALAELGRAERATPFMVLLAAFQLLLARWSGETDVSVGAPIALRESRAAERLIGFFVNTLVMRSDLSGEPSFRALLARVREVVLAALAHRRLGFEKLVEALNPERDQRTSPLFRVMLNVQPAAPAIGAPGLGVTCEELHAGGALYDLTLTLAPSGGGYEGWLEFDSELFERATAERMARHFLTLLAELGARPDAPIGRLALLGDAEAHALVELERGRSQAPGRLVHQRFADQAALTPDAPAARSDGAQLTYRELAERARKLARHLERAGAAGRPIAVALDPSLDVAVALLGVLEAGSACVPLDPAHPKERLAAVLAETAAPVILTSERRAAQLPESGARVVCLDRDQSAIARESTEPLPARAAPDDVAYVLYTSGSTGRPKGVGFTHRALANLIAWHVASYDARGRTLGFAPLTFDASFHELFSAWSAGGVVVFAPACVRRDTQLLGDLIAEERIERLFPPVIVLQQLAERYCDEPAALASLRDVFATGEALRVTEPMAQLFGALGATLHNHYGPTETHVVTALALPRDARAWPLLPPIGRPIANTTIHILDRHGGRTPIGVPGELYVGGESLARGYLDAPLATAARFVPSPFAPGERLYRTGDLARFLPDGNLQFLRRLDDQAKIRGHRVEPGEVEAALASHPQVQTSVVVARDDGGGARLVAYVVGGSSVPSARALRDHLGERLPEAMIPSDFVFLEALPLTPNGKLDRRALPAPVAEVERDYHAPRNDTERRVAEIWAQVLRLPRVGIEDDFFSVGGHSLLATQIALRISRAFGVKLLARFVFERPSVASLSALVDELAAARSQA